MTHPQLAARRAQVVAMRAEGYTLKEIGLACGVHLGTAHNDLKAAGEWHPHSPLITERNRQIADAYLSGKVSLRKVAAQFGITKQGVHYNVAKYRELTGRQA